MNPRFIYRFLIQEVIMRQKGKEEREKAARAIADLLRVVPRFNENRFIEGYIKSEDRLTRINTIGKKQENMIDV